MAKVSTRSMTFAYPPDAVMAVITSGPFHEANLKAQGNPKVTIHEQSRTADRLLFEAEVEEYVKGVKGINKSKTETTYSSFTWDLKARTAEWIWRNPNQKRAKVWGDIRIVPDGDGARLTENFRVEIKIPIVGRGVEAIVIRETEAFWPKYERLINEFLAKQAD